MQKYFSNHDDFGSFLHTVDRATKQSKSGDASMRIMHTLSRSKQVKVTQLAGRVKAPWSAFNQSLQSLQEAGLIKMRDDEEGGTLWLTEEGEHWASAISLDWDDSEDDPAEAQ